MIVVCSFSLCEKGVHQWEKISKEKNAAKKSGLFSGVTLKKDDRRAEEKENNDNNNDPQDENKSEE